MTRALTSENLYNQKHETFAFDGIWQEAMMQPERNGVWLIWGREKHGKTAITLMLTNYLRRFERVLYISGEEGLGPNFVKACNNAGVPQRTPGLNWLSYETLPDLFERLGKKKAPRVVVLDNTTVYDDELKKYPVSRLLQRFPEVLFILVAHEERGQPYLAPAKLASKLAKIKIHVEGLRCTFTVRGRTEADAIMNINEEKAALYHGQN
jgi:hypothetical protein